jgi:hypothetical protein
LGGDTFAKQARLGVLQAIADTGQIDDLAAAVG